MDIKNLVAGKSYKVLVRCNTYNQSQYITTALNGFAMQITDFPFICVVMDDCSTDGEQAILEKFIIEECIAEEETKLDDEIAHVIIVPHKTNKHCIFVFYFLKENLYKHKEIKASYIKPWQDVSKYEAFCEGDDYWIDPKKLQKQATFLDNNSDFFLVGSNGIVSYSEPSHELRLFNSCHISREVPFSELVEKWFFPTASLMYRTALWNVYPKWSNELHFADDIIVMTSAINGKVACLGDLTCVYRKGVGITKDLDKHQVYMCEQHLLFYNHLLEDTGDRYTESLTQKIKLLEKRLRYHKLCNEFPFLIPVLYPIKTAKRVMLWIYRKVKNS